MATALKEVSQLPTTSNYQRLASRLSIARMDLFAGLPAADLAMLENRLPVVRWPRGGEVPEPLLRPDHLFVVRTGRIAVFESTAPGHEVMTAILDEGNVYSTLGTATEPVVAALDDAAVSPLSGQSLEALMSRYPRLGRNVAQVLSERTTTLSQTVALISEMRVEDRLRARLHQLADRFGVATTDGIQLRLDLTHAQWASLVGASREAVTTGFSKLRTAGLITTDGREIMIPWHAVPPVAPDAPAHAA
jgi:CRP/FNR family cyclic AMP-dependent transcriptional regulator